MSLPDKVSQFNADADIARQIIHGNAATTVNTNGGPVRTLAKLIADSASYIADIAGFKFEAETYTQLQAYTGMLRTAHVLAPGIAGTFIRSLTDTTTLANGGTCIVDGSGRRWFRVYEGAVNVLWFGADKTGVADSTNALKAAHAASRRVHYDRGTYKILLAEGDFIFKGTSGRYRFTGDDAMIVDTTTYTKDGAFTQMFWVDATDGLKVEGINYTGPAIPVPTVNHGYIGATFVRATSGAKNIDVTAYIENARHGIHSGDYTLAALGGCDGIKARLRTKFVGYSVALYLTLNHDIDIVAESTHRCVYLAGCRRGRIHAYFKDQYIAPIQVYLTDNTTNGLGYPNGASVGCTDLDIKAHDMGSTTWVPGSFCAAIVQSRGDAGTYFQNLHFDVYLKSSDTVAATLSAFAIYNSDYTVYQPSYPGKWTNPATYRNITVTGTLDRSAQTIQENNSNGEIYVYTTDDAGNNATMQGISFENFIYLPGSGAKPKGFWFSMPGLVGQAKFDNCNFGIDSPVLYRTNATSMGLFTNCTLRGTYFGNNDAPYNSKANLHNCTIGDWANQPTTNKSFTGQTAVYGAMKSDGLQTKEITLTGASVAWAGFPLVAGTNLKAVAGRVTEAITGATGYQVGVSGTPAKFVDTNTLALGSTFVTPVNAPQLNGQDVYVTAKGPNFASGKLRLVAYYEAFGAPTS